MGFTTLHLTNAWHERSGGIRTMYRALMAQAARERRRIRLVVPGAEDGEERVNDYAVVYRVRAPPAPAFDRRYRMIAPHRFLPPGRGRLWAIVERERPDVVEVCDKYSLCYFAGLLRRRRASPSDGPTLVGLSCERMDDNVAAHLPALPGGRAGARAYLGRVYIGMFDAHLANSRYTAAELHDAMRAPHLRPVHVTPMGVDLPAPVDAGHRRNARLAVRSRLGCRADARLVLYAGRLSPEKHLAPLPAVAAALAAHGNAHLVVAGDGPLRAPLEADCARHAPAVARFVGHVDPRELQELLAAADVFVHPNPREPFGIGPLEAMAAGLPLVAPRAGGVLTYASDDNAWLVAPEPAAFAAAVVHVLGDPVGASARVERARATAERFAWPAAASAMLGTYERMHEERMKEEGGRRKARV